MHLVSDRHLEVWYNPQHSSWLSPGCWQVLCDQSGLVGVLPVFWRFYDVCQYLVQAKTIFQESTWHLGTSLHKTNPASVYKTRVSFNQGHAPHHACNIKSRGKPSKSHHMQQCGTISQPPSIVTRTLTSSVSHLKMQWKYQICQEAAM